MSWRRCLVIATGIVLSLSVEARAQYCPSYPGDYQLNFDSPSQKMVVCKFGDSMRDVCATETGSDCSSQPAGAVTFDAASNRLRFCNGTTWQAMTCGTIEPCSSIAGTVTADAIYAKYCDGTNWQALHLTGTCAGIGLMEGKLTPTEATLGDRMVSFAASGMNSTAVGGDYLFVGMTGATINRFQQGAVAVYVRTGATWTFHKLLAGDAGDSIGYGVVVTADGEWLAIQERARTRVYIHRRDEGGPGNWGRVTIKTDGAGLANAVTLRGDLLVWGTPNWESNADIQYQDQGRAIVYRRDAGGAGNWGRVATLNNPDAPITGTPGFGGRVSLDGDFIAVSAVGWDGARTNAGAVYLFQRTAPDTWSYAKRLLRPDAPTGADDYYGYGLEIRDVDGDGLADSLVVGAPNVDKAGSNVGRIYIYARDQGGTGNWGLVKETSGSFTAASSSLASSVAMNAAGNTVAAAAPSVGNYTGAIAVYEKDQGGTNNWGETTVLSASDGTAYDGLGSTLLIDGNDILSGASYAETTPYPGAVYAFTNSGGNWSQTAKITAPDTGFTYSPRLGAAVAISGEYAAVGMDYYTAGLVTGRRSAEGAVNIYKRDISGNWNLHKSVQASAKTSGAYFGRAIDMTAEYMLVGSPGNSVGGANAGSGWLFWRNEGGLGNWGQIKRLGAPGDPSGYQVGGGTGVAINGNTAVLGAYGARLPSPCSLDCSAAGIAYVFEKDQGGTGNWGLSKTLIPSVHEYAARFGISADIEGDLIVVGAKTEDANGVDSGAAYLFSRDQGGAGNWGETKWIPGRMAGEEFATDVSLSVDTLAVGAAKSSAVRSLAGAVHIYERNLGGANNWGFSKTIYNPTVLTNALFGQRVDLSGDTLIVGAPGDDTHATDAGRVYIFKRDQGGAGNWGLVNTISSDDPVADAQFGSAVTIDGTVLGVGSVYMDGPTGKDSGGAFLFGCP